MAMKNLKEDEATILGYLTQGLSDEEIGEKMEESPITISQRKSRICQKLGYRSIEEMVRDRKGKRKNGRRR